MENIQEMIQNRKGVTLVALVVTIIILIILATISINAVLGDKGLIKKAQQAKDMYEKSKQEEQEAIDELMKEYDNLLNEEPSKEEVELTDIYVTLYEDGTLAFSTKEETIEGKTVKVAYGNIKGNHYTDENRTPWYANRQHTDIKTVVFVDEIVPEYTSSWFQGCRVMTQFENMKKLNTSKVTDMQRMFYACSASEIDLSNFNTRDVTNMSHMFNGSEAINLDLSSFDTSNVTNMLCMFCDMNSLINLNISSFDTSNVVNMSSMFQNCAKLTNLDLSSFNTSKATNMSYMFQLSYGLTTIDVGSGWHTENADVTNMFMDCGTDKVTIK